MSRQTRLVEQAILARLPQRRSGLVAMASVVLHAVLWAGVIYGLAMIVPQVIPALMGLQPKMPPPRGPVMDLVNFIRTPQKSVPVVLCLLVLVDLPMSYMTSDNIQSRRFWSRFMMLIPLGIGLMAAGGFAILYVKMLGMLVKDAAL